tara:strand:- start:29250 stop:30770 length:1521 start_codon:yes stop_codon:yes gene_type:complete
MNKVSQKLADTLEQLKSLQDQGIVAIRSKELSRTHRERLLKHGFIKEVIKGWYIPAMPDETPGDSTSWYTSFWAFSAAYLAERFGNDWCLSAEQSLNLHIGDRTVPSQLLVRSPKARNRPTEFLHGTSIFDLKLTMPAGSEITKISGLNMYSLSSALVNCSKRHFTAQPMQVRTALSMISDASEVLTLLLEGGRSVVAGRIAGAFRNIGRDLIANNILKGMAAADYKVQEVNPFDDEPAMTFGRREISPYVNRLRLMWATMRQAVIACFPAAPKKPLITKDYLHEVDDKYVTDAYHSLSIEGYRVTPDLIEQVRLGGWSPEQNGADRRHVDALAAKGYWDAFQEVKKAVKRMLENENPGDVLEEVHGDWYLTLFGSSVAAGIIKQSDLAGYRNGPVYIRRSMHTPPSPEALRDMMPTLFELLREEENPAVRVVLGHFCFVFIHPYFDGNGRMGRFLMNVMMASGGYSWTVIPVERRDEYMASLEAASVRQDILPFTRFLASLIDNT